MVTHIEPADLAEADANAADYPTVAAQQCRRDVAGLVERLQERATVMEHLSPDFASVCREAASIIQSQAARIAELEALAHELVNDLTCVRMEHRPAWCKATGAVGDPVFVARALLNRRAEG